MQAGRDPALRAVVIEDSEITMQARKTVHPHKTLQQGRTVPWQRIAAEGPLAVVTAEGPKELQAAVAIQAWVGARLHLAPVLEVAVAVAVAGVVAGVVEVEALRPVGRHTVAAAASASFKYVC